MLKIFIFLFVSLLNLFSQTIKFEEEKYVSSLETSVYNQGIIEFGEKFTKVSYRNLSNNYLFFDEYLIIKDKENEQKYNYEEKIELSLFSKLINLIYKNQDENIGEYFTIEKDSESTNLIPNEYLKNSISKIEYKKDKDILKYLKIYFKNEDYIKIVQK